VRSRRYLPGWNWEWKGVHVWVEPGSKSPNDIKGMVHVPHPVPIEMPGLGFQNDIIFEAEDVAQERGSYSQMKTFKGWLKWRDYLKDLYLLGPNAAIAKFRAETAQEAIPFFMEIDQCPTCGAPID
jgi:hypothetical protein